MIEREITPHLHRRFAQYPVLTITGPRQSGKTTLCRHAFPHLPYANMEAYDVREFAAEDPRGFLAQYPDGAVLDEIQSSPHLVSYIQVLVDEQQRTGLFVLTGSQQFKLTNTISQSLAGRTAMFRLWPFSLAERRRAGYADGNDEFLYTGCLPGLYSSGDDVTAALADYYTNYIERDARSLGNIANVREFAKFIRLCAGRVGQPVNMANLGRDTGVVHKTIAGWLDVLEACDVIFRLEPYQANIRKRLTRTPKLYFVDVGLASYLLGIRGPEHVQSSPHRGSLFENAAVVEAVKHAYNRAQQRDLWFLRTEDGFECDLLAQRGDGLVGIEVKSGATLNSAWFAHLRRVARTVPGIVETGLVYGGAEHQTRTDIHAVPLGQIDELLEALMPTPVPRPAGPGLGA